jgi:hypothetical protein
MTHDDLELTFHCECMVLKFRDEGNFSGATDKLNTHERKKE